MKKSILILASLFILGCSADDSKDCECLGKFGNTKTGETVTIETDCDKTPPTEDWVFLDCINETPDY